jgi:hypothetical protein
MAKRYQRCNQKPKDRQHHGQKIPSPSVSDYPFGIFWPWCCLSFGFWLPLWYLLAMVLSVLRKDTKGVIRNRRTDSSMAKRYQRCNQKTKGRKHHGQKIPKGYSEDEGQIRLHLWYLLAMVLSVFHLLITLWYLLAMVLYVRQFLITPLVSFGHGAVCPSSSDYTFGISWPWCCLSFVFWLTMANRYQRCNQKTKDRQHHDQKIPKG